MILTKDEFLSTVRTEVRLMLHLASKIEPSMLDYRPTPKQRSVLELMQYLAIMGPIHFRGAMAASFDMKSFGEDWRVSEAAAKAMDLQQTLDAIASQPALYTAGLADCSDDNLRTEIHMFGSPASRGSMLVSLVLTHYSVYRMQMFLYLKACGRDDLNTMNLWVGVDGKM